MIKKLHWSPCKMPFVVVGSKRNLNFLDRFSRNVQRSAFIKLLTVGAELLRADGQTDSQPDGRTNMTKLIVAFSKFDVYWTVHHLDN